MSDPAAARGSAQLLEKQDPTTVVCYVLVAIALIWLVCKTMGMHGGRRMDDDDCGKSNFAAYTINGSDFRSDGIYGGGGTFVNTSMLY